MDSPALERLVRLGFVTKGTLYGFAGLLALQAAFSKGGSTEDATGTLDRISVLPFGQVLLVLLAVGLGSYSLWRFVQAALDPDGHGQEHGTGAVLRRIGYVCSGVAYGGLAFVAARGALQGDVETSGDSQQQAAGLLLGLPLGQSLLGAIGLVLVGVGVAQVVRGVQASFMKHLDARGRTTLACWAGRIGLGARGVVFGLVGMFFVRAAWHRNAGEVAGTEAALDVLGRASPWLFAAVAAGFVAFAVYCFIQARYRRLAPLPAHG